MPQDLPIFSPDKMDLSRDSSLKQVERAHITNILDQTNWNITKSAEILCIDRSTLYNKIQRYTINKPIDQPARK